MNLQSFQYAIAPQLQARIRTWLASKLTNTQQEDLMQHYAERMLNAYAHFTPSPALLRGLSSLPSHQYSCDELLANTLSIFFTSIAHFERVDANAKITLRINSYEARLKTFLGALEMVVHDNTLALERIKSMRASKRNHVKEEGCQSRVTPVIYMGNLIRV